MLRILMLDRAKKSRMRDNRIWIFLRRAEFEFRFGEVVTRIAAIFAVAALFGNQGEFSSFSRKSPISSDKDKVCKMTSQDQLCRLTRESVAERSAVLICREDKRSNQREMETRGAKTLMRLAELYLWRELLRHESLQAVVLFNEHGIAVQLVFLNFSRVDFGRPKARRSPRLREKNPPPPRDCSPKNWEYVGDV